MIAASKTVSRLSPPIDFIQSTDFPRTASADAGSEGTNALESGNSASGSATGIRSNYRRFQGFTAPFVFGMTLAS